MNITVFGVIIGCNSNNDLSPNGTNPALIPIQITEQVTVPLGGLSELAVLAGSSITSTGATTITGDIGLSPGTSIGGFPPGMAGNSIVQP